jgi:hypothetical protein
MISNGANTQTQLLSRNQLALAGSGGGGGSTGVSSSGSGSGLTTSTAGAGTLVASGTASFNGQLPISGSRRQNRSGGTAIADASGSSDTTGEGVDPSAQVAWPSIVRRAMAARKSSRQPGAQTLVESTRTGNSPLKR